MEEIKKIEVQGQQYGVADMLMRSVMGGNTQVIEWSHTHNMNDYKDAGTYRIKGERTGNPMDDNLPIMNQGSGHTIEGILYVLDSSLTNGSGKEDDCTITQFLMLSNRVGGQEGDMYMRSAYGPNKDSLTWKPWEKYQTNMEVGAVSDMKLLNPNNPTEILKHDSGMNHIIDNGIYSGIYFGPKCMVGTGEDNWHISVQNATAVETFVMVVINNYAAASNARCITQIKFAVTNGGVFSMEKRSTDLGTLSWSQWGSVGGGGNRIKWDDGVKFTEVVNGLDGVTITMGSATYKKSITLAVQEGNVLKIGYMRGQNTVIDNTEGGLCLKKYSAGGNVTAEVRTTGHGVLEFGSSTLMIGTAVNSEPTSHDIILGENIKIGNGVKIDDNLHITQDLLSGGNYLGVTTSSQIAKDVTLKSGTYYGIASDLENRPFVLEVSNNYDGNPSMAEADKKGFKILRCYPPYDERGFTDSATPTEYTTIGYYSYGQQCFWYSNFVQINTQVTKYKLLPLESYTHQTMIWSSISSIAEDLEKEEIPQKGAKIYNHIIEKSRTLNVEHITIHATPSACWSGSNGLYGYSIVEVLYADEISALAGNIPVCYERFMYDSSKNKAYLIQTITEFEELQ